MTKTFCDMCGVQLGAAPNKSVFEFSHNDPRETDVECKPIVYKYELCHPCCSSIIEGIKQCKRDIKRVDS